MPDSKSIHEIGAHEERNLPRQPLSLHELQSRFQQILKGEHLDYPPEWISGRDTPPIPFRQRLAIYHDDGWTRFELAMAADFGGVQTIVGEKRFDALVRLYLRRSPSHFASLAEIGGDFAAFLAETEDAARFPALPDVARFEWLLILSLWAGEPATIDLAALQSAAETAPESVILELHPATFLLESPWSVDTPSRLKRPAPPTTRRPRRLLVSRENGSVFYRRLPAKEWHLLQALEVGTPLGRLEPCLKRHRIALDEALALIRGWVQAKVIGSFRLSKTGTLLSKT